MYYDLTDSSEGFKQGIEAAAQYINSGGLVAFPTETVYGLGADALNDEAVRGIYDAKGRPGDNPLILHVANVNGFAELSCSPPGYAFDFADAFWPGPLTMVAKKNPTLPAWIGTHPSNVADTVGIRMPAHPTAMALIEACGKPIAAPSANKAGKPSPTKAEHVLEDFPSPSAIMVLNGGDVSVGVESTVVDITGTKPRILRPGAITREDIWSVTGLWADNGEIADGIAPRSPGQKYKHYAPQAPMTIVSGTPESIASFIMEAWANKRTGVFVNAKSRACYPENLPPTVSMLLSGKKDREIARNLFSALRQFDKLGVEIIFAESVPEEGLGIAIMDRMKKAAEGRIVYV